MVPWMHAPGYPATGVGVWSPIVVDRKGGFWLNLQIKVQKPI
eukprot:COSAG02_NODE_56872_length_283_cov_0.842391_1_plen_41_part_10